MNNTTNKTKVLVITAVLAGLSTVLYLLLDLPIIPFAPHLKVNFADVPALVAALAVSPAAGVATVAVRCFIHALISGAQTFYIGDAINLFIGTAMVLSFSFMYRFMSRRKKESPALVSGKPNTVKISAVSMAVGAVFAVIAGIIANLILYPLYMSLMGLMIESSEAFIAYMMGVVNANIARAVMNFGVFALLMPIIPHLRKQL